MYYVYTVLPQLLSPCLSGARYALQRCKKTGLSAGFLCLQFVRGLGFVGVNQPEGIRDGMLGAFDNVWGEYAHIVEWGRGIKTSRLANKLLYSSGHLRSSELVPLEWLKQVFGTDMDIEIIKSLTKTGGVVGLPFVILYLIVDNLFQESVYKFLGSDKIFILLLFVIGTALVAVIVASRKGPTKKHDVEKDKAGALVTYEDSTHNGDNRF